MKKDRLAFNLVSIGQILKKELLEQSSNWAIIWLSTPPDSTRYSYVNQITDLQFENMSPTSNW